MLKNFIINMMDHHTSIRTMEFLKQNLGDVIISKNGNVNWPARSPDLTAPDFFMWGAETKPIDSASKIATYN